MNPHLFRTPGLGLLGLLFAASAGASAGPATAVDEATLRHGEEVYGRCLACHAIEANRTGPQHCGLFGRKAGTAPGFDGYSPAMRASGIVWNAETLDRFLKEPLAVVPKTYMTYAGVVEADDRAALIAWLAQATRPGDTCQLADRATSTGVRSRIQER